MQLQLSGKYRDTLYDGQGRIRYRSAFRSNTVVLTAMDCIAGLLENRPEHAGIAYLAVGRGGGLQPDPQPHELRRMRRLQAESFRKALRPGKDVLFDAASKTIAVRAAFGPEEALGMLSEFGLFGGRSGPEADSGLLINYGLHAPLEHRRGETLEREIRLVFRAPDMLPSAIDLLGGLLAREENLAGLQYMAWGAGRPEEDTGSAGDAPSRTVLDRERLRLPLHRSRHVRYEASLRTVRAERFVPFDRIREEIREIGLFGGDASAAENSGRLLHYALHAPIDKGKPLRLRSLVELVFGPKPSIEVPLLVGRSLDEAKAKLTAAGLALGRVRLEERPSDAGLVLEQSPLAGEVAAEGIEVDLLLAEPIRAEVPDCIGLTVSEAEQVLQAAGLRLSSEEPQTEESEADPGTVVRQSVPAGSRLVPRTEVRLVLAVPIRTAVPALSGLSLEEGRVVLQAAGLRAAPPPYKEIGMSPPHGEIVEHAPQAGALVPLDTEVGLTLSGPHQVKVPDLKGSTIPQAGELLREAGKDVLLQLGRPLYPPGLALGRQQPVESKSGIGRILGQKPPAGSSASLYGSVDVEVAVSQTILVPDLLGLALEEAKEALDKAGLVLGKKESRKDIAEAGTVIEQEPEAKRRIHRGAEVDVVLASEHQVLVPDLVGQSLVYAREVATSRGLSLQNDPSTHPKPQDVHIHAQSPDPGSTAGLGSSVVVQLVMRAPNLIGLQLDKAQHLLRPLSLKAEVSSEIPSDRPAGEILSQSPSAKEMVFLFASIEVEISRGLVLVRMPEVIGRSRQEAEAELQERGLVIESVIEKESDEAAGTILEQHPEGGLRVAQGAPVRLIVSRGRPKAVVPDLVGLRFEAAAAKAKEAGLQLAVSARKQSSKPQGTVLDQDPPAGRKVEPGATVQAVVSLGPARIEVPDVRHRALQQGTKLLQEAGLQIAVVEKRESDRAKDTILVQSPEAGEKVLPGSRIEVVISRGTSLIAVPDVRGKKAQQARDILSEAGLETEIGERIERGTVSGVVLKQKPEPGIRARRGSVVVLSLSVGRITERIKVPALTGQSSRRAALALRRLGLSLTVARTQPSRRASGTILFQDPKPGTEVPEGSSVKVVVARSVIQ